MTPRSSGLYPHCVQCQRWRRRRRQAEAMGEGFGFAMVGALGGWVVWSVGGWSGFRLFMDLAVVMTVMKALLGSKVFAFSRA
eukprot:4763663-Ditylum_brightwellii.AAC.1